MPLFKPQKTSENHFSAGRPWPELFLIILTPAPRRENQHPDHYFFPLTNFSPVASTTVPPSFPMTSMPTYDSQESLDFSFVDTTTTAKIKPTPTASAMAPIVAQQDTAMTAPSSSTASANGPKSIRLMNTFQIPSPSPVTTAASTPRRIDTPRYSTLSTSNPVNKVNKVSYSFDDRDRIIPSVKMRTISHDEQVLKNTRKKRASSVDSSHGSSRTGKGTRVSWHVW